MDHLKIYTERGLQLMATAEEHKGRLLNRPQMFHEHWPQLEGRFWTAVDTKDLRRLRVVCEQLAKLCDDLARCSDD
jgi:hypothetical protein